MLQCCSTAVMQLRKESKVLSAFAEDQGLCPWMNADSAIGDSCAVGLMLWRISLLADTPSKPWGCVPEDFTADGRRRVFHGGAMGFAVGLH